MKTSRIVMTLLVGTVASAGALPAQEMALRSTSPTVSAGAPAYDAAGIADRMTAARALAEQGRFGAARKEYRRIADVQKRAGVLPVEALWEVAQRHNAAGNRGRAARTLEELAKLADAQGHPEIELRALSEAAILHYRAGNLAESRACVERVKPLLASPHVGEELRASVARRMGIE